MPQHDIRIDPERLKTLLNGVNRFGYVPETGGYTRPGFTRVDLECRDWFEAQMKADGLQVWRDGALNLFGRYGPEEGPCVMAGSHLDTVVNGGAFDGSLGACVALECVRTMKDAGITPQTAIEVAATSEEEGRFGGMLGSQAIAGAITPAWIEQAVDADGIQLRDAMTGLGLEPMDILKAARSAGSIKAFLELHIEQGPVLEDEGLPIGIAEEVSGVCYMELELTGIANHSGTTPMHLRSDAFAGLSELAGTIPDLIHMHGTDQTRFTIGHVELFPNHPHTIPGRAVFSVILRDTSEEIMVGLKSRFLESADIVANRHSLTLRKSERSWLSPVALDADLADTLVSLAERDGLPVRRMPSGAGHDAQTMQSFCPSGLIFVPSRAGISHAPEEHSEWSDIEQGANLMLQALIDLSG
ncbi:N-carbamoyl-L-amino acid amidohydrolase [Stappia aggregata IAM 12614]|uniref:N-carbamoyl-L-amino acid amidohydrolase n=1 Tax=Roseibium aggregatum (strain ATCC 25650 / DSM 13394 / JCM 20685 / NBRC 16684 / NCIMB 2208 / IAM 12614 / B1) TaxID=384765 RepID=A0NWL5_ROSAI|nr:Zn-dependent hydrolase [Roseibium aggregatum]EAV42931.1 N-carbamoyl-L-amino acid amidohydrolase [Stappia aggregata IAM 12614] [Roseibium aggregatum IAM 12614]